MTRIIIIIALLFLSFGVRAQSSVKDSSIFAPLVDVSFALQFPGGDMANRFGFNSNLALSFMIKDKGNWIYGASGQFLFGGIVKDTNMLDAISTEKGFIIGGDGLYAELFFYERGFMLSGHFGKLFPVLGPNPNSGLFVIGGVGLLQHKIRLEVSSNTAPQLSKAYKKGYDRLSNGLALSQMVGYRYLGNSRLINFFFGVELVQAFTQNRRSYNFDLMGPDNTQYTDYLSGFRFGWTLPLYKQIPREFYFN